MLPWPIVIARSSQVSIAVMPRSAAMRCTVGWRWLASSPQSTTSAPWPRVASTL